MPVGALLDGIPESMVIGISLLAGLGVSFVAVIALFISNIPEGTVISGLAALLGYVACRGTSGDFMAAITALAAGAMLAMLADTMIPEAFDEARNWSGLITVARFLVAFILTKLGG